uniref:Translocation protein SEC62 n=1 Tax=Peromyscus maniculatus bairdii TaxID=230844 RepID=A0A8C8UI04_PERMB
MLQEVGEPSKEEKAVAKYLRFNCPTKSTNMMGHRVDYFIASKAVDCLLDSKWAKAKKGEEALFTTRESVVDYCNRLLKKQFFHRALKVMKMKYDKDIKKEKDKGKSESGKEEDKKSKKENIKEEKTKKEKEKKKDGEKEEPKKVKGSGGERHSDTDSDRREDDRSQHSSGNGNDFEMITKEELEQQTDGDCDEEDDKDGEMPKSAHEKS